MTRPLKKQLLCAALALGTTAGISFAAPRDNNRNQPTAANDASAGNAQVAKAIERLYPGAQHAIESEHTVNNVRVYDVKITPKTGQPTTAQVTEDGDFLFSGAPETNLPTPVQEAVQGLFKNTPQDIQAMQTTFFYVTLGTPGTSTAGRAEDASSHVYQLKLDATGRLLDIRAPRQLHQENWRTLPDAPADAASKVGPVIAQRFPNSKVVAVKQAPNAPDFYEVRLTENGKDAWGVIDRNNTIYSEASTIDKSQLPKPVTETLNNTFKGDRIAWAARSDERLYQIRENINNEQVTIRLRPDGDVISVRTHNANSDDESGATTAGHRAAGKNKNGAGRSAQDQIRDGLNQAGGRNR